MQEEAETRVKLQEFAKTRVNYVESLLREMTDKHSKDARIVIVTIAICVIMCLCNSF